MSSVAEKIWKSGSLPPENIPEYVHGPLDKLRPYVSEFLCAPHPHRKGAICPFVPPALAKNSIYYTFLNPSLRDDARDEISHLIEYYLQNIIDVKGSFAALIVLFPSDISPDVLKNIQLSNKVMCVSKSLMIGALFPTSGATSLHSENYFPLRSPTPILVIRDLMVTDLQFLTQKNFDAKKRVNFLESFIARFEEDKSSRIAQEQTARSRQMLVELKKTIRNSSFVNVAALMFAILFGLLVYAI